MQKIQNYIGGELVEPISKKYLDNYISHNDPRFAPPKKEINFLSTEFERYFSMIKANSEEIQSLTATRDYLLPRLLSGDVRVE
jgi:hypothetical protein